MGTKNNPASYDCYANALPDEPMFILLDRDLSAPDLVRAWADRRRDEGENEETILDALRCADAMYEWRKANEGAWRKPKPE